MADNAFGSGGGNPPDPIAEQVARHLEAAMPVMMEQFKKKNERLPGNRR